MRRILFVCSLIILGSLSQVFALSATLTWTNGTGHTGTRIERQVGTGAFIPLATIGPTETTYADLTVIDGQAYCFRVVNFSLSGDAREVPTVCGSHLAVPTGASGLGLTWQ